MDNLSLTRKPFYFIRHGKTDWNHEHKVMGQQDIPLNEEGMQQAAEAVDILRGLRIEQIIHSPLRRAAQTAEIINSFLNIPIISNPGLKESCKGIIEGKTREEASEIREWLEGETPRGAETEQDFLKRIIRTINLILDTNKLPLLVSHSGVFKVLASYLGKEGLHTSNCGIYYFKPNNSTNAWDITLIESVDINN
ncbi:MAG: Phosphoglycerate mutase [Rickettsiaceae bacterium]|jgi:probable phosphoglycerate mutase|nr:Phosphoglycerate mutase [Rickettsiaceae bacterium]